MTVRETELFVAEWWREHDGCEALPQDIPNEVVIEYLDDEQASSMRRRKIASRDAAYDVFSELVNYASSVDAESVLILLQTALRDKTQQVSALTDIGRIWLKTARAAACVSINREISDYEPTREAL